MNNIILNGREYTVETENDEDMGAPWENQDGCGIVSDWTTRGKRAGELVLNTNRGSKRFYDYAATLKIAARDDWGVSAEVLQDEENKKGRKLTPREVTALSVMRDYEYLHAWCNDEWNYICIVVTAPDGEIESLCGMESDSDDEYLQSVADELAAQLESKYQDRQIEEATL